MAYNPIVGIYKIQSIIHPDRIYIGSSISIKARWKRHLGALEKGKHNPKLQNHYNKYGKDDLIFSILLTCEKEELLQIEQGFIDKLDPWFNVLKIAGAPIGYKHTQESIDKMKKYQSSRPPFTEETCKRISDALKGRPHSKEHAKKTGIAQQGEKHRMFGKKHPKSTTDKMSAALIGNTRWLGKKHKPETIEKMKKAQKGRTFTPEAIAKMSVSAKNRKDRKKKE